MTDYTHLLTISEEEIFGSEFNILQNITRHTIQHLRSEGYDVKHIRQLDPHRDKEWPACTPTWIGVRIFAFDCVKLSNPTIDTNIGKARLLL